MQVIIIVEIVFSDGPGYAADRTRTGCDCCMRNPKSPLNTEVLNARGGQVSEEEMKNEV